MDSFIYVSKNEFLTLQSRNLELQKQNHDLQRYKSLILQASKALTESKIQQDIKEFVFRTLFNVIRVNENHLISDVKILKETETENTCAIRQLEADLMDYKTIAKRNNQLIVDLRQHLTDPKRQTELYNKQRIELDELRKSMGYLEEQLRKCEMDNKTKQEIIDKYAEQEKMKLLSTTKSSAPEHLQNVIHDVLIKNIQLQCGMEIMGKEIDKLTTENKKLKEEADGFWCVKH